MEEIGFGDVELGQVLLEIGDALAVNLGGKEGTRLSIGLLFGEERTGEDASARADFEDGQIGTGIDGVGDALGDGLVGEEMLSETFFGTYFHCFLLIIYIM